MADEEKAREMLIEQLDENDWDMSDEGLTTVASNLKHLFDSERDAHDFVEENASFLYSIMEDGGEY